MAFSLQNIPYLQDIEPSSIWIIPIATTGAYLLPIFLKKAFSGRQDHYPLLDLRLKLWYIHHICIRSGHPLFYRTLHIDVQDNLHFATAIIALMVLKKSNADLRDTFFCSIATVAACGVISKMRWASSTGFKKISQILPQNNSFLAKVGDACKDLSLIISPSQI